MSGKRARQKLYDFMENHESDIKNNIEDFGLLRELQKDYFKMRILEETAEVN